MKTLKKRLKRELIPFGIVLASVLMSLSFYKCCNLSFKINLNILEKTYLFTDKSDLFNLSFIILGLYLFFLILDILYEAYCLRRDFYYYQEFYTIANLLLFVILTLQFSVVQYALGKTEEINTYFLPITTIIFFVFVVIVLRIILKSGSRRLY